jgi:hypothetical protein
MIKKKKKKKRKKKKQQTTTLPPRWKRIVVEKIKQEKILSHH